MTGEHSSGVERVAVVGAGLVGALEACLLAQRGFKVDLYDVREDIRQMEHVPGRSINLAMSIRALSALKMLHLDEHIKEEYGIPMYARMIHNKDGAKYAIPYGKENECIYSVGRRYINEILLDKGETYDNITYHFNHKLVKVDLDKPELTFTRTEPTADDEKVVVNPDLVIGCDGAYSAVRKEMMRKPRFDYSQEYIPHAYMELNIPPSATGDFAMEKNYLHIWPRGQFMMIGLPNQDRSFTLTLFMPTETFNSITDEASLIDFFIDNYRDSIPLIGRDNLVRDFFRNKALPLVSIKCKPYNIGATSVIMGDAAHAMVPFYGQGMNCGMEDCIVLNDCLDSEKSLSGALDKYTHHRNPDAEAMCDLAMYNYIEMRDLVNKKSFLLRKKLDNLLHWMFPQWWVPLYTSVTFTRMRYHECIKNRLWQDQALTYISSAGGVVSLLGVYLIARHKATNQYIMDGTSLLLHYISKYVK
eukprot:TRINITY_DN18778_c0_g1_i1.p1 TRINITY_DN18778_c0_g1~~TRINITY_DN18778_c0_g1_i1.p1  ORF type:complete len:473 (+),score=142.57 TRINITY_DN18778_c0_g1_i1:30-1448(+)